MAPWPSSGYAFVLNEYWGLKAKAVVAVLERYEFRYVSLGYESFQTTDKLLEILVYSKYNSRFWSQRFRRVTLSPFVCFYAYIVRVD